MNLVKQVSVTKTQTLSVVMAADPGAVQEISNLCEQTAAEEALSSFTPEFVL